MKKKFKKIPRKIIYTLEKLKRKTHYKIQHKIHKEHHVSRATLFYMKEYGHDSNVFKNIVKESIMILLLASIISTIGGIALQSIQEKFLVILPLIILLPALNDMIGDFGTIIASKFTTYLFTGKIKGKWYKSDLIKRLAKIISITALISALYISTLSFIFSIANGFAFNFLVLIKIIAITVLCSISLLAITFTISIAGGLWIYKRKEDPDNFLIPITTAIADLGSMLIFAGLVSLFF